MRLFRFGPLGQEKPGVFAADGARLDASAAFRDWDEEFFAGAGLVRLRTWLSAGAPGARPVPADARLGSCVARPSKLVCIGLNYHDHAAETNAPVPAEPIIFFKSTTALCGPNDDVVIPRGSEKTDWEVELAVVIGKRASYVDLDQAADHVAGYALHNDYSERAFQLERGGQWAKGKGCDTFAPLGPWLATADEIPNPHALRLWLSMNGVMRQDGNTSNLIFNVPFLVHYVSQFMTLLPGDVISTGTPKGVGLGHKPPLYLVPGDVVELGIDGLGTSRQVARAWSR